MFVELQICEESHNALHKDAEYVFGSAEPLKLNFYLS